MCAFLVNTFGDQQLPVQGVGVQRIGGAPAKETAHYPTETYVLPTMTNQDNEDFGRNRSTIFRAFNFMSPAQAGRLIYYTLLLSALSFCPPRGIRCALGMVMLNKPENMHTQEGSLPVVVTGVNFKEVVLESKQPVLVEFWAPWSRPCQVMDSVLHELASAWAGNVKVVKVNADDNLDLSLFYEIQSVPTLVYFVRGNPCLRILGTASKEAVLAKLRPFSQ